MMPHLLMEFYTFVNHGITVDKNKRIDSAAVGNKSWSGHNAIELKSYIKR
jgi:hypothetical protein